MASDKGFPSKERETERDPFQDHVTAQPVREKQFAKDVIAHFYTQEVTTDAVEAGSTTSIINATAHSALIGDVISFTSGNLDSKEYKVIRTETNSIEIAELMSEAPAASDTFKILRHKYPLVDADGQLQVVATPGPVRFTLDGAEQIVTEDTVTPANNAPLPVKLTGATGDINITAGDLNVQTSHTGASFDSMRIGDGTETAEISASGELQVRDDDANTALTSLDGKDFATQTTLATLLTEATFTAEDFASETTLAAMSAKLPATLGQKTSAASLAVVLPSDQTVSIDTTGLATESKQDDAITQLTSIAGEDFATQTTLAALLVELQAKADLTETQPVSAASLPLPTGAATEATLASIDGKDFATQTTLAALLVELQAKADLTETQPVSLSSAPLPTDAATETTQATLLTEATFAAEDFASETTLAAQSAKLPAALGSQTSAASLSVTLASDQVAIPTTEAAKTVTEFVRNDYTGTNVTTGAYVELIASTTSDCTKMRIFDSSGQTLKIATGAAASEVDLFLVFPGGNEEIEVNIPSGTRISIQAVSATAASGEISINLIG